MINPLFREKIPFAYNYFSNIFEAYKKGEKNFPQALIFEGSDTKLQYLFSFELARILNCEKEGDINCDCINCKWIKNFSHPEVVNVSQIHYKDEDDTTKTMISVKQARKIEAALTLSCDYHRFFIFFSSNETEKHQDEMFEKYGFGEIDFSIEPLTLQSFNVATPNALLKSIEEPPKRTTFVFLTNSKENILSTIVSRCQVFKLSGMAQKTSYNDILTISNNYIDLNWQNALEYTNSFLEYSKNSNLSVSELLYKLLSYFKDLYKQNPNNQKIKNSIKIISDAIKHVSANISDKTVLEAMFLRLKRGY